MDRGTDAKRMRVRYAGLTPDHAGSVGVQLPERAEAIYELTTKTVPCIIHDVSTPSEPAVVGVGPDRGRR